MHAAHAAPPKKDSKDPKGATADLIPSGPMKGKNPNLFHRGGGAPAKGKAPAKQNAADKKAAFLKNVLKKGGGF
jgi:hypothetical protein